MGLGWISRLFDSNNNNRRKVRRSVNRDRNGKSHVPRPTRHDFRAVSVHCPPEACEAAQRTSGRRFLAAYAPQLPLGSCTMPKQCRCRYRHHNDRRFEARRDSDYGLPGQHYHGLERRHRHDRRKAHSH